MVRLATEVANELTAERAPRRRASRAGSVTGTDRPTSPLTRGQPCCRNGSLQIAGRLVGPVVEVLGQAPDRIEVGVTE